MAASRHRASVKDLALHRSRSLYRPCALIITTSALAWSLRAYGQMRDHAVTTDLFMSHAGALINGFSLLVILWQGLPASILPACA
jgi:hypothetical protein